LEVAKAAAEAFGPLKAALEATSTVYTQYKVRPQPSFVELLLINLQETAAVKEKIEVLRSRVSVLEKVFEQSASDEAEKRRRDELLTYVNGLHSNPLLSHL